MSEHILYCMLIHEILRCIVNNWKNMFSQENKVELQFYIFFWKSWNVNLLPSDKPQCCFTFFVYACGLHWIKRNFDRHRNSYHSVHAFRNIMKNSSSSMISIISIAIFFANLSWLFLSLSVTNTAWICTNPNPLLLLLELFTICF